MIISGNSVEMNACIKADICIVGAGAAGITLGSAFLKSGLKVVIVESGGTVTDPTIQELNKTTSTYLPIGEDARVRGFGGTTDVWAGKWIPYIASDFSIKNWVPNSGWPLIFEDLFPYFEQATQLHGGPSIDDIEGYFAQTPKTLQMKPPHPDLIQTPIYWLDAPKIQFANNVGNSLINSESLSIYTMSTVVEILPTENNDSVSRLDISTPNGNRFFIKPRFTILACGGIENARCMLASREHSSAGIGNETDTVGRYYMDHPKSVLANITFAENQSFPECFNFNPRYKGRVDLGLRLSDAEMEKLGVLNSYLLFNPEYSWSGDETLSNFLTTLLRLKQTATNGSLWKMAVTLFWKTNKGNLSKVFLAKLKSKFLKIKPQPNKISVQFHMEQAPEATNRVILSSEKDIFGKPLAHVDWKVSKIEKMTVLNLYSALEAWVKHNKIGKIHWVRSITEDDDWDWIDDASHHAGTTRMGNDPKTSVVDKDCKVHTFDNLYIAGGSVFPTSGFANPTWTITALALRLADHLKRKF